MERFWGLGHGYLFWGEHHHYLGDPNNIRNKKEIWRNSVSGIENSMHEVSEPRAGLSCYRKDKQANVVGLEIV